MPLISLVIPFYNEQDCVGRLFERLEAVFDQMTGYEFEVIAVNDGSRDETLAQILLAQKSRPYITLIDLSRNFGKEAAITAGLDYARGDAVIPMDCDLQHPPEVIPTLIAKWREGYEVVLAKRVSRETDGKFQRMMTRCFYAMIKRISETPVPMDVGDFRLMDKVVVKALSELRETRRFMKGLFGWVGFHTATVTFEVGERHAGTSTFNFWKRWNLAIEGVTSFSTVPIRIWTYLGTTIAAFSILYSIYEALKTLLFGVDVPGYASLMSVLLFSCGIQLIGLGVIGEYAGRVYVESKHRPIYIVRKTYRQDEA